MSLALCYVPVAIKGAHRGLATGTTSPYANNPFASGLAAAIGLQLRPKKRPGTVLVIEQIHKPTEN